MNTNDFWKQDVWDKINGKPGDPTQPGLLKATMGPMRVAQHIFPTIVRDNDSPFLADTIDLKTGIPTTGNTRSFATINKPFQLFQLHIEDPALTMAMNQVMLAAESVALVEDMLFFQGQNAVLPPFVSVDDTKKLDDGLLGIAASNHKIPVPPSSEQEEEGVTYGIETFEAVVEGISFFTANLQGPPYALILEPAIYADTYFPLEDNSMVTPASAIKALVEGGFVMSPGLPAKTGLLVSLGGKTTTLYVGTEPRIEFDTKDHSTYEFDTLESIQFHNVDRRALIKLEFQNP